MYEAKSASPWRQWLYPEPINQEPELKRFSAGEKYYSKFWIEKSCNPVGCSTEALAKEIAGVV